MIKPWSERLPEHPALVEASGAWTYRQLASAVSDTQRWLRRFGCAPGRSGNDRVRELPSVRRDSVSSGWSRCVAGAGECTSLGARSRRDSRSLWRSPSDLHHERIAACPGTCQAAWRGQIQDVAGLGPIAIGPMNDKVEPEPIDDACRATRRRVDLYIRHDRASQRCHVDAPEPAVRRSGVRQDPVS